MTARHIHNAAVDIRRGIGRQPQGRLGCPTGITCTAHRHRRFSQGLYFGAAAMSRIENIQREDLSPLEEAHGLQRLVKEFGLTHELAAQAVRRSRSAASNRQFLLNLADLLMASANTWAK